MQLNDKVFIGSNSRFTEGVVTKITPTGFVDVQVVFRDEPLRFNAKGRCLTKYHEHDYIDEMPYTERLNAIAREHCAAMAANAMAKIVVNSRVNRCWSKETMAAELDRLQELLTAARAQVEAL